MILGAATRRGREEYKSQIQYFCVALKMKKNHVLVVNGCMTWSEDPTPMQS
jgi:hypothetical protein